jgi:hypothetical protein
MNDQVYNSSVASLKILLVDNLDFSTTFTTRNFFRDALGGFSRASIHIKWSGLTGTLDGSLKLQQNNHPTLPWSDISNMTQTLNSASGDVFLDVTDFAGDALNLVITKANLTAGLLSAVLILKR